MAPTALADFTPAGIDMTFAVSQQNLNQGLAEYIDGLQSSVSWGFDVDDNGNVKPPVDPAKPNITFSGTLASPTHSATGPPIWIVDLSQAGAANQVTFNLTFKDGVTFTDNQTGRKFTQSIGSGGSPWVIPFQVDMSLTKIQNNTNIPQWLKDQMAILNGTYGEVFDLSQVLLDLETLAMTADPKTVLPKGISLYEWTMILTGMNQYLKDHSGVVFHSAPTVGYAVSHNGSPPTRPVPTYTPTAVDIVIVPDLDNHGSSSALVFVFMVEGAQLPSQPANSFNNVKLFADPTITPGVALISSPRLISFLQSNFAAAGIAGAISQYVETVKSSDEITWQLAASSTQASPTPLTPESNGGVFLTFRMPTQTSDKTHAVFMVGTYEGSSTTDSDATTAFGDKRDGVGYAAIVVSGTFSMWVDHTFTSNSTHSMPLTWKSPNFDWKWNSYYEIQSVNAVDAQSGGGVQFALRLDKSSFPAEPTSSGGGDSWGSAEPSTQFLLTNLLAPVIRSLPGTFQTEIKSLSSIGNFVFPGGGIFTFQDPAVNNSFSLYTTIKYQNPN